MINNEYLDAIIVKSEYDCYSENEVETKKDSETKTITPILRQPKTTKAQFNKIAAFMNEHSEAKLDKVTFDLLWDHLAADLNELGPSDHTTSEWRRIWSLHKHNKKRKRLIESDDEQSGTLSPSDQLGQPSCSGHAESTPSQVSKKLDELSNNFDVFIKNQAEMITNQKLIIKELQSSNKFLQEMAKRHSP